MFRSVYNFFHMLRKDSGAHFTYNLGVGLIRASLLFILWALLITAEWYFISSPRFEYIETFPARVVSVSPRGEGIFVACIETVPDDNDTPRQYTEYVSRTFAQNYWDNFYYPVSLYNKYRLTGRGRNAGERYGFYLTMSSSSSPEWQYFFATPGAKPPVSTWGIWASLAAAVILFIIGKRQIKLSMKYPRSDVPLDVSGAPVPVYDDIFRDGAVQAYRAEVHERLHRRRLTAGADEGGGEDEAPVP